MSITSKEHRTELERFGELLASEAYETELVAAPDPVPYDILRVTLVPAAPDDRVWQLEMSFLPGLEDELDDVSILQCNVALSEQTAGESRAELERLLAKINAKLPIGGFGLLDHPPLLFFKHNALLANDLPTASDRVVLELVSLITYLISTFSAPLIAIATGEKTVDEARPDLPFRDVIG